MKQFLLIATIFSTTAFAQELKLDQAKKIFDLPTHCISVEYPNKLGNVLGSDQDLKTPKQLRPIFMVVSIGILLYMDFGRLLN